MFEKLSVSDGLSHYSVHKVVQDADGFMWFATSDGLNKYDGYSFKVFRFDPTDSTSLVANSINTLFVDSKGNLWVGTFDGLCKFLPATENFFCYQTNPNDSSTLSNNYIKAIYEDKNGMIWIGTAIGLNRLNPNTNIVQRFMPAENGTKSPNAFGINCITADPRPNSPFLWIGTNSGGINRVNIKTLQFKQYFTTQFTESLNKFYSDELVSVIENLKNRNPNISIDEVTNSKKYSKTFEVINPSVFLVLSSGEGLDKMYDYGWIENINFGKIIWEANLSDSRAAGGTLKNRVNINAISLDPGSYSINYKSDESHSFELWNASPPNEIFGWGIKLWEINQHQAKKYSALLDKYANSDFLSGNNITALKSAYNPIDNSYSLYAGISGSGIDQIALYEKSDSNYSSNILQINHFPFNYFSKTDQPNFISDFFVDKLNSIWIGTNKGIFLLNNNDINNIKQYKASNKIGGLSNNFITSFQEDHSGILWISTASGINKFNRKRFQFNFIPLTNYNLINNEHTIKHSVKCFYEDEDGYIWLGLSHGGLIKFDPTTKDYKYVFNENSKRTKFVNNTVNAICKSPHNDDELWIATFGAGIIILNKESRKIINRISKESNPNPISSDFIYAMKKDSKGVIWFGMQFEGIMKYDPSKRKFYSYERPDSIIVESELYLQSDQVWCIQEDNTNKKQTVWVGTVGGSLSKFDVATEKFTHYFKNKKLLKGITNKSITSLYIDSKNNLWVGTYSGGLNLYDRGSDAFSYFTVNDGLPNNQINSILEDENGNLWLSTNLGVSKFDPLKKTFTNYNVNDGLQGSIFNRGAGLKSHNGNIFFGGINGFNYFNPEELHPNNNRPGIVITGLKVISDDKSVDISIYSSEQIVLQHFQNYLTFEFAALEYTIPEKNTYKFILNGVDKDWMVSDGRRYASYTNIPPGDYTFQVMAANSDGVWSENSASIKISIVPPWYKTWWFYLLLISAIIFAVFYTFNYRLRTLRKQKEKQVEFSRKLILSQENERHRIASELHDSLGQNMLIIKNEVHQLSESSGTVNEFSGKLNEISDLTLESIREVREIAYNLHPHQLERLGLRKAIESVISKVDKSSEIRFETNIDAIDNLFSKEAEINLYRIIQESVNNVVKHSEAKNTLLNVNLIKDELQIIVSDDGKGYKVNGFDNSNTDNGLGIRGIVERVNLLKGNLKINSELGEGTSIRIILPIKNLKENNNA